MKIIHFLAKICHFGGHFEFSNFSGIKRHRRSNIMTDSCSTLNLAVETTCVIPDFQKKFRYAQSYFCLYTYFAYVKGSQLDAFSP